MYVYQIKMGKPESVFDGISHWPVHSTWETEDQAKEANTQIEDFKSLDTDGIKKAADVWKEKAEAAVESAKEVQAEHEKELGEIGFQSALSEALSAAGVKDPKDVIPHLNRGKLMLSEDGDFTGLNEQLEPLKKSKDYLFSDGKTTPKIVDGAKSDNVIGDKIVDAAREAAGLVEDKK